MALARPCPWRQAKEVHTELRQAGSITQLDPLAGKARFIERRRIESADNRLETLDIDFLAHCAAPASAPDVAARMNRIAACNYATPHGKTRHGGARERGSAGAGSSWGGTRVSGA